MHASGLTPDGARIQFGLEDLAKYPARSDPFAMRAHLDMATCQQTSITHLAPWLPPGVSNRHRVYSAYVGKYRVHLPALVLLRAFFRPFGVIAPVICAPRPLADLCIPSDVEEWRIAWTIRPVKSLREASRHHEAVYVWVWTYPSGRTLWQSVYRCARAGILGVLVPRATIDFIVEGELIGERELLASKCTLLSLTPNEEPFTLAQSAPKSFCLHGLERRFSSVARAVASPRLESRPVLDGAVEFVRDPRPYFETLGPSAND